MKICGMCKQEKPLEDFSIKRLSPDGHQKECKQCMQEYNSKTNPFENPKSMYVNGKYVSRKHPLYKPGRYKTLDDAWSHADIDERSSDGQVYIIGNKAWEGWYKVGKAVSAIDRLNNYQTSSPYRDYELLYAQQFPNRHSAESEVHKLLRNVLADSHCENEWFKADFEVIKDMIEVVKNTEPQLDLFKEAV